MPATDKFAQQRQELISPLTIGFAITPSNSADLPQMTREIYFGTGGNVRVTWAGQADGVSSVHAVQAGERLPWRISRVWVTDTSAGDIEGFA